MRGAIAELETWKRGHKARTVEVNHDDGYGASCWNVTLKGENKGEVYAAEVNFLLRPAHCPSENVVFVYEDTGSDSDPDFDDWPGLARVILLAIDTWNAGKRWPKTAEKGLVGP